MQPLTGGLVIHAFAQHSLDKLTNAKDNVTTMSRKRLQTCSKRAVGGAAGKTMGIFLPAEFRVREQILSTLAISMAAISFYWVSNAEPRAAAGIWLDCQFLGTVLFVSVSGRDRTFFTGLYNILLSGALAIFASFISIARILWLPDFAAWPSHLPALLVRLFVLFLSVAIPVAFAWLVTRVVQFLERRSYR